MTLPGHPQKIDVPEPDFEPVEIPTEPIPEREPVPEHEPAETPLEPVTG